MAPLEDIVQPTPLQPPRLSLLASVPIYEVILPAAGAEPAGPESDTSTARTVSGDIWRIAALTFTPEPCGGEGGTYDPSCGPTNVDISGDKSTVQTPEHFHAFGVYEPESCSTFGFGAVDTDQRSRRALGLDEAKQVEREFWKGTRAQAIGGAFLFNRWLARNVAEPTTLNPPAVTQLKGGAAQTPVRALAELEQAIADGRSGGRCLIHASRRTITFWTRDHMLYRAGNLLLTVCSDTIVVPGEGYDGSAPDGSLDATRDTAWAYATGPIEIFRGPVEMLRPNSPELTGSNRRTSIATRKYALEVDPCVYVGIKVTHS